MTGSYRYRTTGCGSPWIVAPDRGRVRNDGARFVRPADEPPAWLGVLIAAFGLFGLFALIAAVLIVSAVAHQTPNGSSSVTLTEAKSASATEDGKRRDIRP